MPAPSKRSSIRAAACWRSACGAWKAIFQKGDVVSLCREDGHEFARGLTNYGSEELRRIAGQPTERIVEILGHRPYDEVVHRDNLAILS